MCSDRRYGVIVAYTRLSLSLSLRSPPRYARVTVPDTVNDDGDYYHCRASPNDSEVILEMWLGCVGRWSVCECVEARVAECHLLRELLATTFFAYYFY